MSAAARSRVLAGYRRLNRARTALFQGDDHAMKVTRQEMKAQFIANRHVNPASPEWEVLVAGIDEAADMLKHEIVRGELNEQSGRYEIKIERQHVAAANPQVEPITTEMYERMADPAKVQVHKSSGNDKK